MDNDLLSQMQDAESKAAAEATQTFGIMTAAYYNQLIEEGIREEIAIHLTSVYVQSFFVAARGKGEDEE